MNTQRRTFGVLLAAAMLCRQGLAQQGQPRGMNPAQKMLIPSLPVLPWMSIAETRMSQVRGPIQQLIASHQGSVMVTDGQSVETGGSFINLATASKFGLLGIDGLSMLTLDFDRGGTAQLVAMTINRGWRDKNIGPLIRSLAARYASITEPVTIGDPESEATDRTVLFDIGRFIIEVQIPQHGTFLTTTFTTKALLQRLRTADRSIEILRPYLEGSGANLR